MTVSVGDFKQQRYNELAVNIRQIIMDYAKDNHLTLVEAVGLLETVKMALYLEQVNQEEDEYDD
jgi:hypothetical protein